jgi:hypothetical protein
MSLCINVFDLAFYYVIVYEVLPVTEVPWLAREPLDNGNPVMGLFNFDQCSLILTSFL